MTDTDWETSSFEESYYDIVMENLLQDDQYSGIDIENMLRISPIPPANLEDSITTTTNIEDNTETNTDNQENNTEANTEDNMEHTVTTKTNMEDQREDTPNPPIL